MQKHSLTIAIIIAILATNLIVGYTIGKVVKAASTNDMTKQPIGNTGSIGPGTSGNNVLPNENEHLQSVGSTEAPTNTTIAKSLVVTAIPDKASISVGKPEIIHVKAAMENGTGLSNVTIRSMIIDYVTSKEKVLLGGKTDKKGELDLTAQIGPHAKPGQFLALVNATSPDGQQKGVSTGFVVTDSSVKSSGSGSSSSSSKDSKGRCSGSSCR
jgi:hypothetical protein